MDPIRGRLVAGGEIDSFNKELKHQAMEFINFAPQHSEIDIKNASKVSYSLVMMRWIKLLPNDVLRAVVESGHLTDEESLNIRRFHGCRTGSLGNVDRPKNAGEPSDKQDGTRGESETDQEGA